MKLRMLLSLAGLLAATHFASAENWPQFRGPAFNGASTEKALPLKWSKTENVVWSVPMPGPSAATPIVWGDSVFVPSADTGSKTLLAYCIDRQTGKIRWQQKVAEGLR